MIGTDTIIAISTAVGAAPRMMIRLSGAHAAEWMTELSQGPLPPVRTPTRLTLRVQEIPVACMVIRFAAPASYTGEDLLEIHLPGNPLLVSMVIDAFISRGARQAEPGEFSARALFHGKMDLSAAEGVAATISATNAAELAAARRLQSGELAQQVREVSDQLAHLLAMLEAGIDFSDQEDVRFISPSQVRQQAQESLDRLLSLLDDDGHMEALPHDPVMMLAGRPNAGKSTLLNALAGHQRAMVCDTAGTTRDVLSVRVMLRRGMVVLRDAAGWESSPGDDIARQMQRNARDAITQADHLLWIAAWDDPLPPEAIGRVPDLIVRSRIDTARPSWRANAHELCVSALASTGLEALRDQMDRMAFGSHAPGRLLINRRHRQEIREACDALSRTVASAGVIGDELLAMEIRECLDALGRIVGKMDPDQVLSRVFATFCIGK